LETKFNAKKLSLGKAPVQVERYFTDKWVFKLWLSGKWGNVIPSLGNNFTQKMGQMRGGQITHNLNGKDDSSLQFIIQPICVGSFHNSPATRWTQMQTDLSFFPIWHCTFLE
jgi:hypothetical protein